jgi:hypothetical protein
MGFELIGFDIDSGRGVDGGAELVREREGGRAAVRSSSIRVRERDGRQRADGAGRWKTTELTDRVGPPVGEGEATGRLGRKGREEGGRGWAGKGGRRPGRNCCSG